MSRRGFTLIEAMVAVAVAGVGVSILGGSFLQANAAALEVLERERALQLLEHEAGVRTGAAPHAPVATAALLAELPAATLSARPAGALTELRVEWRTARGRRTSATLFVLEKRR